jgi:hypothetical protein
MKLLRFLWFVVNSIGISFFKPFDKNGKSMGTVVYQPLVLGSLINTGCNRIKWYMMGMLWGHIPPTMSGWWYTSTPLKNMNQLGSVKFPTQWKVIKIPCFQTTKQMWYMCYGHVPWVTTACGHWVSRPKRGIRRIPRVHSDRLMTIPQDGYAIQLFHLTHMLVDMIYIYVYIMGIV